MRTIAIAILIIIIACTASYAEDKFCVIEKQPKATEPVGAVVETAGVFVGVVTFVTASPLGTPTVGAAAGF